MCKVNLRKVLIVRAIKFIARLNIAKDYCRLKKTMTHTPAFQQKGQYDVFPMTNKWQQGICTEKNFLVAVSY